MFVSPADRPKSNSSRAWLRPALLVALLGLWCLALGSPSARADFGIESESFKVVASNSADPANEWEADPADPATQAGVHPFIMTAGFRFNVKPTPNAFGEPILDEDPKDAKVLLPAGMVGNPTAAEVCLESGFETGPTCPISSQVGTAEIAAPQLTSVGLFRVPLFNIAPEPGKPGELGFAFGGVAFHVSVTAKGSNGYRLESEAVDLTQWASLYGVTINVWGVPGDPRHDAQRTAVCNFGLGSNSCVGGNVAFPGQVLPFFSLPTQCGAPLSATLSTDSWQQPGRFVTVSDEMPPLTGCESLEFDPKVTVQPKTPQAAAPSGYSIGIEVPQNEDPDGLATAHVKDVSMTLPKGVAINPSSANGLGACTDAQVAIGSDAAAACPDNSKIGTVRVDTPPLAAPLTGFLYLGTQQSNDPQSGQMFRVFLVASGSGVTVKLPGQVKADPVTGQLSTSFVDNPQMPFEKLQVDLFEGASASLKTPNTCGAYTTTSDLTPWAAPELPAAKPTSTFEVSNGAGGGACLTDESKAANSPAFSAGSVNPTGGAYSPFVLKLTRADGSQPLRSFEATLPPGLSARFAGVSSCSDAALKAAEAKSGAAETLSPSCSAASRLGSVDVAAGAGPTPVHVGGTAYLAGPYKGAPYSIAVITPALAGPFDLGTVVVRSALYIDRVTAQGRVVSDPLPAILKGVPLDLRSITVNIDRPDYTLNPTSCDELAVTGLATSIFDQAVGLKDRFQVGDCGRLGFKPKLSLRLVGKVNRTANPRLIADLKARPGDANIAKARVKLPHSAFLDNAHIGTICTRVQFSAHQCPPASIYGKAWATSPILDYKVAGPVYLRSSDHVLPDLVADLQGPATQPVEIELSGKTDAVKGALRNTFEAVPDVPVTRFHLELFGGRKGLIDMSSGFCAHPNAQVNFDGQNGKSYDTSPTIGSSCPKKKHKSGRGHGH
jgi:hypothetical protein